MTSTPHIWVDEKWDLYLETQRDCVFFASIISLRCMAWWLSLVYIPCQVFLHAIFTNADLIFDATEFYLRYTYWYVKYKEQFKRDRFQVELKTSNFLLWSEVAIYEEKTYLSVKWHRKRLNLVKMLIKVWVVTHK